MAELVGAGGRRLDPGALSAPAGMTATLKTLKCIFEAAVYELYPKSQEPQTEWEHTPSDDPRWRSVLPQEFSNMAAVQQGMKSLGFPGTLPNPYRERSTVNLHYQLSRYMGAGEPQPLPKGPEQ